MRTLYIDHFVFFLVTIPDYILTIRVETGIVGIFTIIFGDQVVISVINARVNGDIALFLETLKDLLHFNRGAFTCLGNILNLFGRE